MHFLKTNKQFVSFQTTFYQQNKNKGCFQPQYVSEIAISSLVKPRQILSK